MYEEPKYYWVDVPIWRDQAADMPSWWDNFHRHCWNMYYKRREEGNDYNIQSVMNYELKPYGAKYKHRNTQSSIRFNDESGFTLFLLKWA